MLNYCHLDSYEQTSVKLDSYTKPIIDKMHLKMVSAKWQPFCPGGDELNKFQMFDY